MRSPSSITGKAAGYFLGVIFVAVLALPTDASARDLRLAVLAPDNTANSRAYADGLSAAFARSAEVLDSSLAASAYDAISPKTPFNMDIAEARSIGTAIGCDFFILIKSDTLRRSSYEREEYYESYAAIYAVSSHTGRLVNWSNPKSESAKRSSSVDELRRSIGSTTGSLIKLLRSVSAAEAIEPKPPPIDELPPDGSPLTKEFRSPVPYRRIKPEYTSLAFLYEVAATVEIEMDLDAAGTITRLEISRWAGYGLDESAEKAVRLMNWRPAERGGKPLPMRVLLRYNFKKIDK